MALFFGLLRSKHAHFFCTNALCGRNVAFSDEIDPASAVKTKINPQTKAISILLCKSVINNCKNPYNNDRSQELQSSKPSCRRENIRLWLSRLQFNMKKETPLPYNCIFFPR